MSTDTAPAPVPAPGTPIHREDVDLILSDAMDKLVYLDATRYDFRKRRNSGYAVRALINHMKKRWAFRDHGPVTLDELCGPVVFGGIHLKPDPEQLD